MKVASNWTLLLVFHLTLFPPWLRFSSVLIFLSSCLPPYPDSPNQIPTEPPAVSLVANTNEWQGSVWSRGRMKGGNRQHGGQETSERRHISASYCMRPCSLGSGFVTLCLQKNLLPKTSAFVSFHHLLSPLSAIFPSHCIIMLLSFPTCREEGN